MRSMRVAAISKKPPLGIPVFEKNQFVPYYSKMDVSKYLIRFFFKLYHIVINLHKKSIIKKTMNIPTSARSVKSYVQTFN